ncbi:MAG: penicillin-binding transpeptidase domain-containing protein, partial [Phycisphaeraceae bacterium]|nr:penicillin-binding transpeptidase domain-containing protein [Phycisphaeraceae bacterium]
MKRPVFQRRIRPRLTGLFYVGINGLLGLAAMHSQVNLLFWMFGLMVGGAVVSVAYAGWNLRGLEVVRHVDGRSAVGRKLEVRYRLSNRKRWLAAFGIRIRELGPQLKGRLLHPPEAWADHVAGAREVDLKTLVCPTRRGELSFCRVEVSTAFPLGLMRFSKIFELDQAVLVYPKLQRLKPIELFGPMVFDRIGRHASQRKGGREEFYGLRKYQHGDSIRQIDWKHTARIGEPVSRELTRPEPPLLMLLLDLRSAADEEAVEETVGFAASVAHTAFGNGLEVGLRVVGGAAGDAEAGDASGWLSLPPGRTAAHRAKVLGTLARLERTDADPHQALPLPDGPSAGRWVVLEAAEDSGRSHIAGARVFGLGEPTGIDLPAERTGLLQSPDRWSKLTQASMAFGQEISATPLQLATAISAVANGGLLMTPYVVAERRDQAGNTVMRAEPSVRRRVLDGAIARRVGLIMEQVVADGTGEPAQIPG